MSESVIPFFNNCLFACTMFGATPIEKQGGTNNISILTKNAYSASTVGFRLAVVQRYEKNSNIVTISRLHAEKNISTMS